MMTKLERRISGRRVTVELDEIDCELICSALKLAQTTRIIGRGLLGFLGHHEPETQTPACDERELKLLQLLGPSSS